MRLFLQVILFCIAPSAVSQDIRVQPLSNHQTDRYADFDYIAPFRDEVALVRKGNKFGMVDKNDSVIIAVRYDFVQYFRDGIVLVGENYKYGAIRIGGKQLLPIRYDDLTFLSTQLAYGQRGGTFDVYQFGDGTSAAHQEDLIPVYDQGKWGYINGEGKVVIPFVYDDAHRFHCEKALVYRDGRYMFINAQNQIKETLPYSNVRLLNNGFFVYRKVKGYGWMASCGGRVDFEGYKVINGFHNPYILVSQNGKYGYLNNKKEVLLPLVYDDAEDFHNGLAYVRKDGERIFIDTLGNTVFSGEKYDRMLSFSEGLAWGFRDRRYFALDTSGQEIFSVDYDKVEPFLEGVSIVEKDNKYGIIDKSGNIIVPLLYDDLSFEGDNIKAERDDYYGVINTEGRIVAPIVYDYIYERSFGRIIVNKNDKFGLLDRTGKELLPVKYDDIDELWNGLLVLKLGDKSYIAKIYQNEIIETDYENIESYSPYTAIAKKRNGKYGLLDRAGNLVEDIQFDQFSNNNHRDLLVRVGEQWGSINETGQFVIPPVYDELRHTVQREYMAIGIKEGTEYYINFDLTEVQIK
ncbi:MAG TPA: WG repeat-containing protein [Sphingobacterium sp.]|nr:WG repeat-containing protein [Sphingobacterium sp.]